MKVFIRLFLCILFMGTAIPCSFADDWKVLEQSEKKIPDWIGTINTGTIQANYEAPSLREAENGALEELRRRIIMAVATNVSYSSIQTSSERLVNDDVTSKENFDATTRIAAAKLPFIKGVSLSEAKASFWQKVQNKKSNQTLYRYSILYPLSESELTLMRKQFKETDDAKMADLKRLKEKVSEVSSAEEISEAENTLSSLEEYFFDEVRRKEASSLRKQYSELYSRLTLTGEAEGDGEYRVWLLLDGRPFRSGARPTLQSDCATRLQAIPEEGGASWLVTYNAEDCLPGEVNTILFSLRLKTARLKHEIHID